MSFLHFNPWPTIHLHLPPSFLAPFFPSAFNCFFSWLKIFEYLHYFAQFRLILNTLGRLRRGLRYFAFTFIMIYFSWALAFMLVFGTQIAAFRNVSQSFLTLMKVGVLALSAAPFTVLLYGSRLH